MICFGKKLFKMEDQLLMCIPPKIYFLYTFHKHKTTSWKPSRQAGTQGPRPWRVDGSMAKTSTTTTKLGSTAVDGDGWGGRSTVGRLWLGLRWLTIVPRYIYIEYHYDNDLRWDDNSFITKIHYEFSHNPTTWIMAWNGLSVAVLMPSRKDQRGLFCQRHSAEELQWLRLGQGLKRGPRSR